MSISNTSQLEKNCMIFLGENSTSLDITREYISIIEAILSESKDSDDSKEVLKQKIEFLNYELLILFIYNDLLCYTLNFHQAKISYQRLTALQQLYVIVYEGYKKIYAFGTYRSKTYWAQGFKKYINSHLASYKAEYDRVSKLLAKFETTIKEIEEDRHLFVHYDTDSVKVYDACMNLETEKEFRKVIDFLDIIEGVKGLMVKIANKNIEL